MYPLKAVTFPELLPGEGKQKTQVSGLYNYSSLAYVFSFFLPSATLFKNRVKFTGFTTETPGQLKADNIKKRRFIAKRQKI